MEDETEPLYEKISPCSTEYVCTFNGQKCEIATQHFADYTAAVEYLARNRKNYTFFVSERNLCTTENCPVWEQFIQNKQR